MSIIPRYKITSYHSSSSLMFLPTTLPDSPLSILRARPGIFIPKFVLELFWKMSVNFGMEAMLPCEESEALVGAGLGLMLATDSITEFSLSTESLLGVHEYIVEDLSGEFEAVFISLELLLSTEPRDVKLSYTRLNPSTEP